MIDNINRQHPDFTGGRSMSENMIFHDFFKKKNRIEEHKKQVFNEQESKTFAIGSGD